MALITTTTPNLVGGVTQQSDSLRFNNQCTEQVNANPSVTKGLEKRPPTEYVARLKKADGSLIDPAPGNYKVHTHTINRDTNERYIVTVVQEVNSHGYTDGKARANIYVHDIDGNPKTVEWDPDLAALDAESQWEKDCFFGYLSPLKHVEGEPYYQSGPSEVVSPGDDEPDIKFTTIADVTLLMNTKVSPQENFYPWLGGPLNGVGKGKAGVVHMKKYVANAEYKVKITGSSGWTISYEHNTPTHQIESVSGGNYEYDHGLADAYNYSTGQIAQYLWSTYFGVHTELENRGFAIDFKGPYLFVVPTTTNTSSETIEIAVSGPTQDSISSYVSNVSTFSDLIDLAVPNTDSSGNLIPSSESNYAHIRGHCVKIEASPSTDEDDYWVEHVPRQKMHEIQNAGYAALVGRAGRPVQVYDGRWRECPEPGSTRGFQIEYGMPLILISKTDGTFLVKRADGTTPGGGSAYSGYNWKERYAGNEDTNPMPSFVNKVGTGFFNTQIQGMTFHNNRLVFITDENLVMSESGDIWNFFRTTVTSLLDSDPIDVATTSSKISLLRHAVGYEDRLLLMSDQTQFLAYGDPVITPTTIGISPVTNFEASKTCAPVIQGGSVFFPFKRGSFSGVREWYSETANNLSFGDADITAHIPAYIEGDITKLAASTNENILAALSSTNRNTVYLFNYFGQGGSREQFAWSKYTLDDGAIIQDVEFISETAYLTVQRPAVGAVGTATIHLEKIDFQPNRTDSGSEYLTRLDRRVDNSQCTSIAYAAATNSTSMVLPFHGQTGSKLRVVSKTTGETVAATFTAGSTTITIPGDWSASSPDATRRTFWAGEEYEMSYTFSQPLFKPATSGGSKQMAAQGRHQLRYGTLIYSNSGPFDITVTHADGTEYSHPFTGKILGSDTTVLNTMNLNTGEFRFPLFSESNSVTIKATSTSAIGPHLESAEFEANYSTRSRRM